MTTNSSDRWSYIFFSAPALLIYSLVIIAPVLYSVILSFTAWSGSGTPQFNGLENYQALLGAPEFRHALYNNALIILVSVFVQIPLGFVLSWIIYRKLVRGGSFFQSVIFLPVVISPVVIGLLFQAFFGVGGVLEAVFADLRNQPLFLLTSFSGKYTAIIPVLTVLVWMFSGLYMVIFLANLQKISPEMLEAAQIEGASELQIMLQIAVPGMVPVFVTSIIYAISGSLKSFDLVWVMTNGGPSFYTEVLASYMFKSTFQFYNYGYGAAITVVIVLLSVVLIQFLLVLVRRYQPDS